MNAKTEKFTIAISSRALFDMTESHTIFETMGLDAYADYQIEHEENILPPGHAFSLVQKLLNITDPKTNEPLVEIILLSRNSPDTGLRIFNSIAHHKLNIVRAVFSNGQSPYQYIEAFKAHLFLSAHHEDVINALEAGCAAATIVNSHTKTSSNSQLRIAFDGDSVLFSDEAERIFQSQGLAAFSDNESKAARKPLSAGPLKGFLEGLHQLQSRFQGDECPIRTALVTARSAPAHERVIHTFRTWDIRIDEAFFLGGLNKAEFVKAFDADFFFDDQAQNCAAVSEHVASAHVPHGIINEIISQSDDEE